MLVPSFRLNFERRRDGMTQLRKQMKHIDVLCKGEKGFWRA
jgi:hypothetical protein